MQRSRKRFFLFYRQSPHPVLGCGLDFTSTVTVRRHSREMPRHAAAKPAGKQSTNVYSMSDIQAWSRHGSRRRLSFFGAYVSADVLDIIFRFCSSRELANLSGTSRYFKDLCRADELWLPLYKRTWGAPRTNILDRRLSMFHLFARRHARRLLRRNTSFLSVYALANDQARSSPSLATLASSRDSQVDESIDNSESAVATSEKVIFAHKLSPTVLVSCSSLGHLTYYQMKGTGNVFERRNCSRSIRVLHETNLADLFSSFKRRVQVEQWRQSLTQRHTNKALMAFKVGAPSGAARTSRSADNRGSALTSSNVLAHVSSPGGDMPRGASESAPTLNFWSPEVSDDDDEGANRSAHNRANGEPKKPWWSSMTSKRAEKRLRKKMQKKERSRRKKAQVSAKKRTSHNNAVSAVDSSSDVTGAPSKSSPSIAIPGSRPDSLPGSADQVQCEFMNQLSKSPIQVPARVSSPRGSTSGGVLQTPRARTKQFPLSTSPLDTSRGEMNKLDRYMPRRRRERSMSGEKSDGSNTSSAMHLSADGSDVGSSSDVDASNDPGSLFVSHDTLFANDEFESYASMSALAKNSQSHSGKKKKLTKKEKRSQRKAYKQQKGQKKFEKWKAKKQEEKKTKVKSAMRKSHGAEPTANELAAAMDKLGVYADGTSSVASDSTSIDGTPSRVPNGGDTNVDSDSVSSSASSSQAAPATTAAITDPDQPPVVLHRVNVDDNSLHQHHSASESESAAAYDMTVVLKSGEAFAFDLEGALRRSGGFSRGAGQSVSHSAGLKFPPWVRDTKVFRLYYAHLVDADEERGKKYQRRRLIGFTATAIHAWDDNQHPSTCFNRKDALSSELLEKHSLLHRFDNGSRVSCARVHEDTVFFSTLRSGCIRLLDAFTSAPKGRLRLNAATESIHTMQIGAYKVRCL